MPETYTPTAEHLAALGYAPADLDTLPVKAWPVMPGASIYCRRAPWPVAPYFAWLVVSVQPTGGVLLDYHAQQARCQWQGWPVPTPLFFEQLLQALGWPTTPETPENFPPSPITKTTK